MKTRRLARWGVLATVIAAAWSWPSGALAQFGPDPYNIVGEYNRQYEPYMYAVEPNADSLVPNQARMLGRAGTPRANRFQSFVDSLDGEGPAAPSELGVSRRGGAGVPYYRANRRYDQEFSRVYRPNGSIDAEFYSDLDKRNLKYFDAIRESDHRKRLQLLREYNMEKLRAARTLSSGRQGIKSLYDRGAGGGGRSPLRDEDEPAPDEEPGLDAGTTTRDRALSPDRSSLPVPLPRRGASTPRPRGSTLPFGGGLDDEPSASRRSPTPSDVLERSDVVERATRAGAPLPRPRTSAPAPR